jgi:ribonucleoside-diphosphate reductase alpha chain
LLSLLLTFAVSDDQFSWLKFRRQISVHIPVPPCEIPGIPQKLAGILVTAHEVIPEWHIRIQAAFQAYTDNAVSKTVNLRSDATVDDVDKVYRLAFELGCKGITVYRDGCREHQAIAVVHENAQPAASGPAVRPRVRTTEGSTTKFRMGCGTLFVTVNNDERGLCEVFANLGKAGGCPAQSEATCRAVSVALRCGVSPEVLIEQLRGIRCLSAISQKKGNKDIDVLSCPDAIARAIEQTVISPAWTLEC